MNPLRFEHFTPDGTAVAIPLKGTPALEIWPLESNGESRPVKVSLLHQASPTYQSDESNKKVRKTNHSTSLPIRECTASVWLTKSLPTRTLCLGLSDGTVCFWRVPDNPLSNATGGGDVQSFLTYVSLEYTHHEEETIQSLVALRANPAKIGVRVVLALTSRALYAVCLKYIDGEATAYAVCKHLFTTLEASDEAQVVRVQGEDMLVATNTHVALYKLDLMEGGSHIDVASCSLAAVTLVRTFLAGHTRCPSAMAFLESRDRAAVRFVTADAIQPTISVWSGTRSRALAALTCTACAVDLVVQGSLVLTCHGTPTVWIWWDDGSRARLSSAGEGRNRGILHLVYRVTATDHWNIPTAFFSSYPTTLLFISNETSVANSTKLRGKPALLCAVAAIPADLPDPATWNLPGEELPVRDLEITFGWTESSHPSSRTDQLGLPKEPRQVTHGDAGIPLSLAHHARVTDDPEVVLARSEAQRRSDTGSSTAHSQSDHLGVTMRMSTLRTMLQYITSCDFTALRDLMYATSSKKDIESILEILPAPYGVELLRIFVEDLSMEPMVPNCTSPVQSMQTLLLWIRCLLQAHGRHFVLLPYIQPYLSSIRVVLTEHTRHRSVLQNLHTRLVLFGEMCSSAEVETLVTEGGLSDARAAAVQHFSVEDHGIVKRSI